MIEERIDALIKVYEGYIDENNQSIKKHKNLWLNRYIGDMLIYSTLMMSI